MISDATYNTARAEVALAWLTAVILPEKEVEEKDDRTERPEVPIGKGKGRAADYDELSEEEEPMSEVKSGKRPAKTHRANGSGSGSTSHREDVD